MITKSARNVQLSCNQCAHQGQEVIRCSNPSDVQGADDRIFYFLKTTPVETELNSLIRYEKLRNIKKTYF